MSPVKDHPHQLESPNPAARPFIKTWPLPDGFFGSGVIASALGVTRAEAIALARMEGWPSRRLSSEMEFRPGAAVATKCATYLGSLPAQEGRPTIAMHELLRDPRDLELIRRAEARRIIVQLYLDIRVQHPELKAAQITSRIRRTLADRRDQLDILGSRMPRVGLSDDRIQLWVKRYRAFGYTGLLERKRGRVGRRAKVRATRDVAAATDGE